MMHPTVWGGIHMRNKGEDDTQSTKHHYKVGCKQ